MKSDQKFLLVDIYDRYTGSSFRVTLRGTSKQLTRLALDMEMDMHRKYNPVARPSMEIITYRWMQ